MQQCNLPKLMMENVHSAAERLQSKIDKYSYLLLNPNPRSVISPELSQNSALDSPRSSSVNKNDEEWYCEKLRSLPSPKKFDLTGDEGGEGGVESVKFARKAWFSYMGVILGLLIM